MEQGDDRSHVGHGGVVLGARERRHRPGRDLGRGVVRVVGDGMPRMPMNLMARLPDIEGWFGVRLPIIWGWKCRTSRDGSGSDYRTSGDGLPDIWGWFVDLTLVVIGLAPSLTIRTFARRTQQPGPAGDA